MIFYPCSSTMSQIIILSQSSLLLFLFSTYISLFSWRVSLIFCALLSSCFLIVFVWFKVMKKNFIDVSSTERSSGLSLSSQLYTSRGYLGALMGSLYRNELSVSFDGLRES